MCANTIEKMHLISEKLYNFAFYILAMQVRFFYFLLAYMTLFMGVNVYFSFQCFLQ